MYLLLCAYPQFSGRFSVSSPFDSLPIMWFTQIWLPCGSFLALLPQLSLLFSRVGYSGCRSGFVPLVFLYCTAFRRSLFTCCAYVVTAFSFLVFFPCAFFFGHFPCLVADVFLFSAFSAFCPYMRLSFCSLLLARSLWLADLYTFLAVRLPVLSLLSSFFPGFCL